MKVTVVSRKGRAALVEYLAEGRQVRRVIPTETVDESGLVSPDVLSYGIPYGIPWATIITCQATPQQVEVELQRHGIWTAQDALARPNDVTAALMSAYGLDLGAVLRAARSYAKEEVKR